MAQTKAATLKKKVKKLRHNYKGNILSTSTNRYIKSLKVPQHLSKNSKRELLSAWTLLIDFVAPLAFVPTTKLIVDKKDCKALRVGIQFSTMPHILLLRFGANVNTASIVRVGNGLHSNVRCAEYA